MLEGVNFVRNVARKELFCLSAIGALKNCGHLCSTVRDAAKQGMKQQPRFRRPGRRSNSFLRVCSANRLKKPPNNAPTRASH